MRSRAEVDATLQTAKLNPAELLPAVHCLSFGPQAGTGDCCLLQLEPGLCAELEAGRRYGWSGAPPAGRCVSPRAGTRPVARCPPPTAAPSPFGAWWPPRRPEEGLRDRDRPAPRREAGVVPLCPCVRESGGGGAGPPAVPFSALTWLLNVAFSRFLFFSSCSHESL